MNYRNNAAARLREIVLCIMIFFCPASAFAVSTVTVSSPGNGVFLLQGSGLEGIAALEVVLAYDTASLSNPRVVPGPLIAGAMTAINPNVPGTVRMAVIRLTPLNGSGVLATLTFDRIGTGPGAINAMSVKLADIDGTSLPALVKVVNPAEPAQTTPSEPGSREDQQTAAGPSGTGTTDSTSGKAPLVVAVGPSSRTEAGNTSADAGQGQDRDAPPAAPDTAEPPGQDDPAAATEQNQKSSVEGSGMTAESAPSKAVYRQKSVLDRFREFRGKRTAPALLSLFDPGNSMIGCRQEPPVVLSDGKTTVKVAFVAAPGEKSSSDIAVMGARLLSMKRDNDNTNTWIVELLPEKGTFHASLAVSLGAVQIVYPLTVAPKIEEKHGRPARFTRDDLRRYIERRRSASAQDGGTSYVDDYIYTANYLANAEYRHDQKPRLRSQRQGR